MIELTVIIAFAVLFIQSTTWEGMIFDEVANYLDTKLPEWLSKPLYGCPICMSFWYGTVFYCWYNWYQIRGVELILVVFAAAGINAAIVNLNKHLKDDD